MNVFCICKDYMSTHKIQDSVCVEKLISNVIKNNFGNDGQKFLKQTNLYYYIIQLTLLRKVKGWNVDKSQNLNGKHSKKSWRDFGVNLSNIVCIV